MPLEKCEWDATTESQKIKEKDLKISD